MLRFYLLILLLLGNFTYAQVQNIAEARNFFTDGKQARQNKTPILIMFSTPDCPYCALIKEEVILPMSQMKEYHKKIIIRHINANSLEEITDFYNKNNSHGKLAFEYGVHFFPTIILTDDYGVSLGKIIGVPNIDYYWYELDKIIIRATKKFKQRLNAKL